MNGGAPRASRTEELERSLAKIAADAKLNAWAYVATDEARAAARASDARQARGASLGPLDGELIALKANIAVRGWPHDGGLPVRRGMIAAHDAPLVERLKASGAILLGQTKMDAGALGAEGRATDGPIRNPHRPTHSVGGSSGGSAAAIAAGHCRQAIGTDTIGSVRIPASYCGIASLKPGAGRISLEGVLPVHPEFDHVGPMAATAAALEPLLRILCDPTVVLADSSNDGGELRGRRLGYVADLEALAVTPAVQDHYAAGLQHLSACGAVLEPIALAALEPARVRRAIFTLCEHQMWLQHRDALARQPQDYPGSLTAMLNFGATIDVPKRSDFKSRIRQFRASIRRILEPLHALVLPSTPSQAFAFDGPPPVDLADLTAVATAAALPAVSVPLPTGTDLPIGLQIIVAEGAELRACRIAATFETQANR